MLLDAMGLLRVFLVDETSRVVPLDQLVKLSKVGRMSGQQSSSIHWYSAHLATDEVSILLLDLEVLQTDLLLNRPC